MCWRQALLRGPSPGSRAALPLCCGHGAVISPQLTGVICRELTLGAAVALPMYVHLRSAAASCDRRPVIVPYNAALVDGPSFLGSGMMSSVWLAPILTSW